jgi:predicted GIY-YIG superfamily endonuclease
VANTERFISGSPIICGPGSISTAAVAASEFVKKYSVYRLVHVEESASPREAILREKRLKEWHRDWKIRLIEENNPDWSDLSGLI